VVALKVCGITKAEDARYAASLGFDAIGFIFYPQSPRYIEPEKAKEIIEQLPPFVNTVGVFVNDPIEKIKEICSITKITTVQLHGDESPEFCKQVPVRVIKAFGIDDRFSFSTLAKYQHSNVSAFLLDKHSPELVGGTGQSFDWHLAKEAKSYGRIILAGGITPFNVISALNEAEPYGLDVNSGVEILPGEKNRNKLRALIENVRRHKPN
jgi:phosphoribosylanthranilate isomerase